MKKITIAIDGFSSCGKSTMAKDLAREIGYIYIDSGAMYRAVTLYSMENGLFTGNDIDTEKLKEQIQIRGIKPVTEEEYERRRKKDLGEDEDSKPGMRIIRWKKFSNKRFRPLMSILCLLSGGSDEGISGDTFVKNQSSVFFTQENFDLE